MPELKHFDPQIAVQAVENAAKVARERLDEATRDALTMLKVAQDGILALERGVGPLLERAEHVFVATFTTDSPRRPGFTCDPYLGFDVEGRRVQLDTRGFHQGLPGSPTLQADKTYRAIVLLEPVE
jgi:hypothetical protein